MALKAIISDRATAGRFQYDEDGTRRVKQGGKRPFTAASKQGQDPFDLYAADLVDYVKSIDADSVLVNGKPGGGSGGEGGGGTGKTIEQVKAEKRASGLY